MRRAAHSRTRRCGRSTARGKNLSLDKGTDDASTLTSYFSPNTPKQRSKAQGKRRPSRWT